MRPVSIVGLGAIALALTQPSRSRTPAGCSVPYNGNSEYRQPDGSDSIVDSVRSFDLYELVIKAKD